MSNLVHFPGPKHPGVTRQQRAVSKNRAEALAVIVPQLMRILNGPVYEVEVVSGRNSHVYKVGSIFIRTFTDLGEINFRIDWNGVIAMSGAINPRFQSNFEIGGIRLWISTWRRLGWEAELFPLPSGTTPPSAA